MKYFILIERRDAAGEGIPYYYIFYTTNRVYYETIQKIPHDQRWDYYEQNGSGRFNSMTSFTFYENATGVDFAYIESLMHALKTINNFRIQYITNSQIVESIDTLIEEIKGLFRNKMITFDFNQTYNEFFDENIVTLAKKEYFKQDFTSTNGSNRRLAILRF